jgi:hypothetical protein
VSGEWFRPSLWKSGVLEERLTLLPQAEDLVRGRSFRGGLDIYIFLIYNVPGGDRRVLSTECLLLRHGDEALARLVLPKIGVFQPMGSKMSQTKQRILA